MENLSFDIRAELKGLNKSLDKASANIEGFARKNEARFKKFGQSATRIGKQMSVGLSAPLALLGANAVRTFASFDDQMRKVSATMGATSDELSQMTEIAQDLGSTTRFTARQAAEGLEFMALAGFSAKESMAAIPDVLNLAAASAIDLGMASDIVTDTMSAFSLSADQAANVSDVLAKTQSSANATVLQLGESFKFSTANAATFGQDLETLSATLGVFADSGVKGSRAGTAFNAILRDLKGNAKDGVLTLNNQSIALADSEGNFRDLLDIMTDVESATKYLTQSQRAQALDTVFQEEAIRGVNILMTQGVSAAESLRKKLYESGGSAKAMADEMEGGLGGALRSVSAAFEGFNIELGKILEPLVKRLTKGIRTLLKYFSDLSPTTKKIIVVVAGLAAAAGPLLLALGGIATVLPAIISGLALLTGPIGIAVAGVVALAAGIVALTRHINENRSATEKVADAREDATLQVQKEKSNIESLLDVARDEQLSKESRLRAIKKLNKISPEYLGNIDLENVKTKKVTKSVDKYIEALNKKALATSLQNLKTKEFEKLAEKNADAFENYQKRIENIQDRIFQSQINPMKGADGSTIVVTEEELRKKYKEEYDKVVRANVSEFKKMQKALESNIKSLGLDKTIKDALTENDPVVVTKDVQVKVKSVMAGGLQSQGAEKISDPKNEIPKADGISQDDIKTKLGGLTEEFVNFNQDLNNLVNGSIANTLSDLGNNIGQAIASGQSVMGAVGNTLLNAFSGFLSDLGTLLIQYGLAAKAKGAIDAAIVAGGPAAIGAGIAAVAIGVALKGIAASIKSKASSGTSSATGASASGGSSGTRTNVTSTIQNREIILRARGRDLVAVLNQEQNFGNIVGG